MMTCLKLTEWEVKISKRSGKSRRTKSPISNLMSIYSIHVNNIYTYTYIIYRSQHRKLNSFFCRWFAWFFSTRIILVQSSKVDDMPITCKHQRCWNGLQVWARICSRVGCILQVRSWRCHGWMRSVNVLTCNPIWADFLITYFHITIYCSLCIK